MPLKNNRRRGVQLLEVMLVLPIVGIVLTAVALSVAGTQGALRRVQQQAVELATVDRFAEQFREDVHRAIRLPEVSGPTLEIERLEGLVRYDRADAQLVRQMELPDGRSRATFEIAASDSPWTVAGEEGLVRFAWEDGKQIVAAWPGTANGPPNGLRDEDEAAEDSP